jgi:hypothetical protein
MASSKKKTLRRLGTPPSQRRSRALIPPIEGLGFPVSASVILDVTRIQGVWEEWYRSGVIDRPWHLGAYLELLPMFLQEGLIDWSGLESMKPVVMAVLERVRTGRMTLEEFQKSMDQSRRDYMK